MFGVGDEMFGKWETKCLAFRRTKVRRKSPAAYQEAQIQKNICRTFLRINQNFIYFESGSPLTKCIKCNALMKIIQYIIIMIYSANVLNEQPINVLLFDFNAKLRQGLNKNEK